MPRTMMNRAFHVIMLVLFLLDSAGVCDEQTVRKLILVDETLAPATFEELTPAWSVVVHVDGERRELARSDYLLWGSYADQDRSPQVLLTDGSVLVGDLVRIEAESITIASRLWGELPIARRWIRACLLLPPADPLERDRQWQLWQASEPTDRILLLNGDTVAGNLLPTAEQDAGGLFGLVSMGIELLGSGTRMSVQMGEVRAITFQAAAERGMAPECLLGFRDGSLVAASGLTQAAPHLTRLVTAAGASLQLQGDAYQENLTFIQPRGATVDYLSDLPAVGYKSLPFLGLGWPLGVATNTLGGRLRAGGKVIFKGLGMHSGSRVAYHLDRKYRRFAAELALDDHAQRQGSVVYRVLVEREGATGQRAWQLAFSSSIVRGGDPPVSIAVDVTDATRLALVVEMADRVHTRDYANWLNARLLR